MCLFVELRVLCTLDTVQDFLIKLGIEPQLHFFTKSCHRHTYQNYEQPPQNLQNLYFQSHFSASKINQIFLIFFGKEYLTWRSTFMNEIF